MTRRLLPALVAWAVSGCGADEPCPICDEPVDTDGCVPGDWTFEDGECSGCRPVPECLERNLGLESSRDEDSICSEHTDCEAGRFCGAGYCRQAEEEQVTLCIEEGWFVGDALPDQGTPPDFVVVLFELYSYGYPEYPDIGTGHAPDTCHPQWKQCFVYPLIRAPNDTLLVRQRSRVDINEIQYASLVSGGNEAEQLGRLVDQGCQPVRRGDVLEDGNMTVWFSVWYP